MGDGLLGWAANTACCLWTLFVCVIFSLPTVLPVTKENMNYASVCVGSIVQLCTAHAQAGIDLGACRSSQAASSFFPCESSFPCTALALTFMADMLQRVVHLRVRELVTRRLGLSDAEIFC
ncbi:hypothetical protein AcV5_010277 [Taiwanofungus camphoratus]|nr:hypothetical protein AcV5_010277 [Antrodia cinnamomea]